MRSMTGRSRELAEDTQKSEVNIACVQKTKWIGDKIKEIGK